MKRFIIKYLKKHLTAHPKHYYFLRWLAEYVKDEKKTKDALHSIAYYISEKNLNLPYLDIFVVGDTVYVHTSRPGLWIGKAGSNHEAVEHRMNFNLKEEKIANFELTYIEDTFSSKCEIDRYIYVINKY